MGPEDVSKIVIRVRLVRFKNAGVVGACDLEKHGALKHRSSWACSRSHEVLNWSRDLYCQNLGLENGGCSLPSERIGYMLHERYTSRTATVPLQ